MMGGKGMAYLGDLGEHFKPSKLTPPFLEKGMNPEKQKSASWFQSLILRFQKWVIFRKKIWRSGDSISWVIGKRQILGGDRPSLFWAPWGFPKKHAIFHWGELLIPSSIHLLLQPRQNSWKSAKPRTTYLWPNIFCWVSIGRHPGKLTCWTQKWWFGSDDFPSQWGWFVGSMLIFRGACSIERS